MTYTSPKAGMHIPLFTQMAPMLGFALGASGLLPKLVGQDTADKMAAQAGGNYGGGGTAGGMAGGYPGQSMTSAPRPGDDFSGGPGHYGGGPTSGGPSSFAAANAGNLLSPNIAPQTPMPASAPQPPTPAIAPPVMQAPAAPMAQPQAAVPITPPAGPAETSTPAGDADTGSGLNPQAAMKLASLIGGQGGQGGLGGLGGLFPQPKAMEMPQMQPMQQPRPPAIPDMSQLAMGGGARNQLGAPMGPAGMNPIYMLQRRMMGLA